MRLLPLLATLCLACEPPRPPLQLMLPTSLRGAVEGLSAACFDPLRAKVQLDASVRLLERARAGEAFDFIATADDAWMDALADEGRIDPATRRVWLRNRLVVVVPAASEIKRREDLLTDAVGRFAVASPNVPAGRLTRMSLNAVGILDALAPKLVEASDVRNALSMAAEGQVDAAVAYRSDAEAEARVRVFDTLPAESHLPVQYSYALSNTAAPRARRLLECLRGDRALATMRLKGFETPDEDR
jgi:molybdate transport system substrate-binding protein